MRISKVLILGLVAVACAPKADTPATASAPAVLSKAALDTVKAVDAAFATAMNAKDTVAVLANYADDATLMPPDSPALDKEGAATLIKGLLAAGASDFALTPATAYGTGDLAYIVGTVSFKMNGVSETDKYAEVLRRGADGKWRYVVDMFSGITPPASATPAKK